MAKNELPWVRDRTILVTPAGAQSYVPVKPDSVPSSRTLVIPPLPYLTGFREEFTQTGVEGRVVLGIKEFFRQAVAGGPVLEMLFTPRETHLVSTDIGNVLLSQKEAFLATSLASRIYHRAEAELADLRYLNAGLFNGTGHGFVGASNLIRMFRQVVELLTGQGYIVWRHDAEDLLEIQNGSLTRSDVDRITNELKAQINSLWSGSPLPPTPDLGALGTLCSDLIQMSLEVLVQLPVTGNWKAEPMSFDRPILMDRKLSV